ncbi:MAG: CvpA family protein, partial [Clostridia bacterium]|nr:CvpA family protein [Clostridia bacterium]
MHFVVDILLVGVLGFLAFRGWKRGFAESVLHCGRLILSLVITLSCGSAFSAWIDRTWIHPPVFERIHARFMDMASAADGRVDTLIANIPAVFRPYLDLSSADPTQDLYNLADQWSGTVADGISGVIASVVGYILLFILVFGLLTVAILLLRGLTKLPVIHTVDSLLGLALGAISGLLAVALLSAVLGAVLNLLGYREIAECYLVLRLCDGIR